MEFGWAWGCGPTLGAPRVFAGGTACWASYGWWGAGVNSEMGSGGGGLTPKSG